MGKDKKIKTDIVPFFVGKEELRKIVLWLAKENRILKRQIRYDLKRQINQIKKEGQVIKK